MDSGKSWEIMELAIWGNRRVEFSGMINPLLKSLRPRQWTKNLFIFAALLFSEKGFILTFGAWKFTTFGFFIFCMISGSVYLLNDLVDIDKDRLHPEKCHRPIAAGLISVPEAKMTFILLLIASLAFSAMISSLFFISAFAYFAINVAYSFWLKNVVILDVLCIAMGFVVRAQAGVGALALLQPDIQVSPWLLLSTFVLATFLGLSKRRGEIRRLQRGASLHRKSLEEYSLHFLDEMTSIVGATALITYAFYTVAPETIQKFGTDRLVFTVPLVLYGIFRYLYLIHIKDLGDNPSEILLKDRPLQATVILWVVMVFLIIHLPHFLTTVPIPGK